MIKRSILALLLLTSPSLAHDTWVETNTNLVRTGDAVYVDLKLGNHGNDHRDFKLASKIDLESCTLNVLAPRGKSYDLKPSVVDTGYAPKEGYWKAKFVAGEAGMYMVAHTLDKVVNHGKAIRALKSGKTYFVVSDSLDNVSFVAGNFDQPLGHPLELVPTLNPVTPMGPGQEIAIQLLLHGEPLSGATVSFIPRSETLKKGFDENYERITDEEGRASFTPKTGDQYLAVVHHREPDASGEGFESTAYSATLTIFVPEVCPCCQE